MTHTIDMRRGVYRRLYAGATTGKRINSVSDFAERLFWRLNMIADDLGNFPADVDLVSALAMPRLRVDFDRIADAIAELVEASLIKTYEADGDAFGHIVGWEDLQPPPCDRFRKTKKPIQRYPLHPNASDRDPPQSAATDRNENESEMNSENKSEHEDETQPELPAEQQARPDTSSSAADSTSLKSALGKTSLSSSPTQDPETARLAGMQTWLLAVSPMWSKVTAQQKSDRTDSVNLFDDLIWPESARDGPARLVLAKKLIEKARCNAKRAMPYLKSEIRRTFS